VKGYCETCRAQFHSTSEISQEISGKYSEWMREEFGIKEESNIPNVAKGDSRYQDDLALMDEIGRNSSHSR
jgi:hypothetical protein